MAVGNERLYRDIPKGQMAGGAGNALAKSIAEITPPTTREQLEQKRLYLVAQLELVNDAIKALDDNPGLERFHESIKRGLNL